MFNGKSLNSTAHGIVAITATFITFAPVLSHAEDSAAATSHVKYSDLNINTPDGARHLFARIEQAANSACGTSDKDTDVIARGPGPCVREAVARAVRDLKNSNVAQVYIEHNGVDAAAKYGISTQVLSAKN